MCNVIIVEWTDRDYKLTIYNWEYKAWLVLMLVVHVLGCFRTGYNNINIVLIDNKM